MPSNPRKLGAVIGFVAVGAGLAASELSTHVANNLNNPIISIGNRVIDAVPNFMKELVIRIFGVNDKTFLLTCITITVAILAISIGRLYVQGKTRKSTYLILILTAIGSIAA